jgi:hypothetical protein
MLPLAVVTHAFAQVFTHAEARHTHSITLTPNGTRLLAVHSTDARLDVLNKLSGTISVIGTAAGTLLAEVPLGSFDPMPVAIREGRGFLFDARLSGNGLSHRRSQAAIHCAARTSSRSTTITARCATRSRAARTITSTLKFDWTEFDSPGADSLVGLNHFDLIDRSFLTTLSIGVGITENFQLSGPLGQVAFIGGVKFPVGDDRVFSSGGERVEPASTAGSGAWDGLLGAAYMQALGPDVAVDVSAQYSF